MSTAELRSNELLQVLRLPQVCKVTGLCRSMIYQPEAEQRFPARIKIGLRAGVISYYLIWTGPPALAAISGVSTDKHACKMPSLLALCKHGDSD
jgi:hypothetical protein